MLQAGILFLLKDLKRGITLVVIFKKKKAVSSFKLAINLINGVHIAEVPKKNLSVICSGPMF